MEEIKIDNFIKQCLNQLAERYKSELKDAGKTATGTLVNTVQCIAEINGQYVEISFLLESYWKYVENGRRAGAPMPPVSAILDWIKIKKIVPSSTGKAKSSQQLAYVIAKSISEKGIEPTKALDKTIKKADSIIDKIVADLQNQISAVVEEDLKQAISE